MTKTILMNKYPISSLEILKSEITQNSIDEIIEYFTSKIDAHPVAANIAIFDHFSHTKSLNGEISPDIKDAKNIVFCFGPALPNSQILAVRPRSIGIAEFEDSFKFEFMEAPREEISTLMEEWVKELIQ